MLGDSNIKTSLPDSIASHIQEINVFIVENVRSARRFIKKVYPEKDIDNTIFYAFGKHDKLNLEEDFLNLEDFLYIFI